jgi:hypothetical protein
MSGNGIASDAHRHREDPMLAMAVPVKDGKTDTWKAWCTEMTGARAADVADMNQRYGLTTHAAFDQPTPDGHHLAVVVLDGAGADTFLEKVAASENEFDSWFRSMLEEVHPMDFSNIPPTPQRVL